MRIDISSSISLSPFVESDCDTCVQLLQDPDVHKGLLQMPYPYCIEDFYDWLDVVAQETARLKFPVQLVIRDENQQLIGGVGAKDMVPSHRCEIGYWLGKPYWGRGIMSQVVGPYCQYLRDTFRLVRLSATVFDGNTASKRVLEKNGFVHEGRMRKHYWKNGQFIDGELYAKVW